jgi:hypothetical protein
MILYGRPHRERNMKDYNSVIISYRAETRKGTTKEKQS